MPYASDKQRKYMHAQHPEIAAKWDEEIRQQKKGMTDKQLSSAHKRQAKFAAVGSGIGLTGLGLLGGSVVARKKPAVANKLKNAAYSTGVVGGANGSLAGINFMRIENENSRRRQIRKDNFGAGFVSKSWDEEKKKYPFTVSAKAHDPEKSRQRRARTYPALMSAGAVGTGALTLKAATKDRKTLPKGTPVDVRVLNNKAVRVGAGLAATGALAAGAAYNVPKRNRREIKNWYPDDERNPKKYVKNPVPAIESSKKKYPHLKKTGRAVAATSEYVQQ